MDDPTTGSAEVFLVYFDKTAVTPTMAVGTTRQGVPGMVGATFFAFKNPVAVEKCVFSFTTEETLAVYFLFNLLS